MGDQREQGIAWTDQTWNPLRGCSRVSPGCENCYAERTAARFTGPGQAYEGLAQITKAGRPQWTGKVRLVLEHLADPLRWKRPRRVFVNSMSDVFHASVSNETIAALFGVMAAARRHTFQILTKRPARMVEWFAWVGDGGDDGRGQHGHKAQIACSRAAVALGLSPNDVGYDTVNGVSMRAPEWPLPNVWMGVTAEDQQRADERVPLLLRTPAAKRFVSVEPQLGPVRLDHVDAERGDDPDWCVIDALTGEQTDMGRPCRPIGVHLDWVITGAESGPGARAYDLQWARMLREQCQRARVAFFLKQIIVNGKKVSTPLLDGVKHAEFPS